MSHIESVCDVLPALCLDACLFTRAHACGVGNSTSSSACLRECKLRSNTLLCSPQRVATLHKREDPPVEVAKTVEAVKQLVLAEYGEAPDHKTVCDSV